MALPDIVADRIQTDLETFLNNEQDFIDGFEEAKEHILDFLSEQENPLNARAGLEKWYAEYSYTTRADKAYSHTDVGWCVALDVLFVNAGLSEDNSWDLDYATAEVMLIENFDLLNSYYLGLKTLVDAAKQALFSNAVSVADWHNYLYIERELLDFLPKTTAIDKRFLEGKADAIVYALTLS